MFGRKQKLAALATLALMNVPAFAALPAGVTTAIGDAGTDATAALGAMILVAVGIWALRRVKSLFGR